MAKVLIFVAKKLFWQKNWITEKNTKINAKEKFTIDQKLFLLTS